MRTSLLLMGTTLTPSGLLPLLATSGISPARKPAVGRLFGPKEPNVLVLTWALFEHRFSSNPAVLGKTVIVDGHPFTIAGVLPKDFRFVFPQELSTGDELRDIDAFIPLPAVYEVPGDPIEANPKLGPMPVWVRVVGRLKPNVPFNRAKAEMQGIFERIVRSYPKGFIHMYREETIRYFRFMLLTERLVGGSRFALMVLFGAVVFVLLIATSNIANLLLARSSTRQRELAIRTSLGAGRMRISGSFWLRVFFWRSSAVSLAWFSRDPLSF